MQHIAIALSAALRAELCFDDALPRLHALGRVTSWDGTGNPSPAFLADALAHATILVTGWGVPMLDALQATDGQNGRAAAIPVGSGKDAAAGHDERADGEFCHRFDQGMIGPAHRKTALDCSNGDEAFDGTGGVGDEA